MFSPNNMAAYVQFIRSQVGLTAPTENRFKCALCDRSYPKKRGLKNHMVIHEGRFECQECGKCCRSQYDLDNHVLTHSGAKLFSCSKCDSSFARSYSFHKHYKVCFGQDPENYPFECETCHEKFRSSRGLKNHQVLHDGNLQCQSCRIRFKSKAELLSHRQIHLDRKSYACSTCFYHTENKSHLSRHNKTCKGKKSVPRRDFISGCEEDCGVTVKQEEYSDLILPEGPRQIHGPDVKKECDLDDYMLLEYSGKVEEQAEGMAEGSRDKAGDDAIWRDQFHALLGNSLDYNLPVPKPEPYDPSFDEPTTIEEPSTSAQVFHQFPTEITDSRRKTHASVQEVLSIGDPQLGGKKEIKLELHEALLRPAPTSSLSIFKFPVRPSLSSHQLWTPAAKLPTTIDIVGEKAKELDLEHVQKLEVTPRWVLS